MTNYNQIGRTYATTRRPDERITRRLIESLQLPPQSVIADIGAGTGNYSIELAQRGFNVIAIEPSEVMRSQSTPHTSVKWVNAFAESIPLDDSCVDGAIVVLACHHFQSIKNSFAEILRITGDGPIVVFTFSPERLREFWLTSYFPSFMGDAEKSFPPAEMLVQQLSAWSGRQTEIEPFPLPSDLSDQFAASCWAKPHLYLDKTIRDGISSFARFPESEIDAGLKKLKQDLADGNWHRRFGSILESREFDAGYRFIKILAS